MDMKMNSYVCFFFSSHVYIGRILNIDIWHTINLRHDILIPYSPSLCMYLNELHLCSEETPANQLQESKLRYIVFSWEGIKICVWKYLASTEISRFQEYPWDFRHAGQGNCAHSNIQVWQQENWVLIDYLLLSDMKQSVAESKWINNQIPAIK